MAADDRSTHRSGQSDPGPILTLSTPPKASISSSNASPMKLLHGPISRQTAGLAKYLAPIVEAYPPAIISPQFCGLFHTFNHLISTCSCKIAGMASSVPYWVEHNNYRAIEHVSEADVITTSFVLVTHLAAQGDLLSAKAAQLGIIRFVRPLRGLAPYAQILGNVADRLRREMNEEMRTSMARVA